MFEPEFDRDRLLQQQPGVLVFAAAVETAQHQEKIDDIGIGAGPAYLQLDLIDLELAQLKLQFGQIKGLAGRNCASASRNSFFFLACRSRSSSMHSTIEGSKRA